MVFLRKLVRIIQSKKIDLVHSHEFLMNTYGTAVSIITGCPIIATIHGKGYYGDKFRRRIAYQVVGRLAYRTVAVSENLKRYLVDNIRFPPSNISVIYNGVDPTRFDPNEDGKSSVTLREELGLDGVVVGAIGNLYPIKGHLYLIRAARKVVEECGNVNFIISGKKTDYLDFLREEIENFGLTDRFRFLGFREDIPRILGMIDIFVLPSLQETYSIATVEALAAAKPVVATRCGGPEEIITDGVNGLLVSPRNSDELAEKICLLIRRPDLRRSLGEQGQYLVRERFTSDIMFKNYMRLYEKAWMQ